MTENLQNTAASAPTATPSEGRAAARVAEPLNVLDKVGMGILSLLGLSGLWMMLAPFLVGFQNRGADWTAGTTNDFVVGLVLAVLSLAAVVTVLGGGLAAIARTAQQRATHEEA